MSHSAENAKRVLRKTLNEGAAGEWVKIAIAFVLFWPLGIYWGYSQASVAKVATVGGNKSFRNFAIFLLVMGIMFLFMGFFPIESEDGEPLPQFVSAFMIAVGAGIGYGGITSLQTAKKFEALSPTYKPFLIAIVNRDLYCIEELAKDLNTDYSTALTRVEEMVELGLFQGAYLDYELKELMWGVRPEKQIVTVSCNSCGATSQTVAGKVNLCKYCGSAL
jgi:hypothetical protein